VLPSLQAEMRINDGEAGRLVTAFMIGYFLTSPLFGYLGDRASRKWLIAAGIFVWSLGTVLTGLAGIFSILILYRVLVGVGEASYATISPSLISDVYGPDKRNYALTIFYSAIPVGAALGNIFGGMISAEYGWRYAFVLAGAPGIALSLLLLPFDEPRRGFADNAETAAIPGFCDFFKLFAIREYLLVVAGYIAYTFALGAFALWGPSFLHRVHGMPENSAATFFGVVLVVAGILGTFSGGIAASAWRRHDKRAYGWVLGLSVSAAVPVTFAALLVHDTVFSQIFLAFSMFLLFLSTGPVNTLIIETVPVNQRASAMALSIFSIHLFGDVWSPEIVGRLSDYWGSLQKAVLILPVALLVCAALWLALALWDRAPAVPKDSSRSSSSPD
jgi:MFS transporter, Spinster family, sphingosine-1-phosphate transporter